MANRSELDRMSREELYELAKKRNLSGRSQMDKQQLVAALSEKDPTRPKGRPDKRDSAPVVEDGEGVPPVWRGGEDRPTTTSRAVWRGAITFGLITIPVGLYTAVEDRDISFRLLSAKDGSRVRYKRVSAESGEEVDWDDIVQGYEYEKGSYVVFTQEELERIPSDSIRAVDVVQFAPGDQIDPLYFDRSYYLAPDKQAVKAYTVLAEALHRSGRVGIAKVTIREKERLATLRAVDGVLVLETMNWPDEIRRPAFEQLESRPEVSPAEVEMAATLIDHLTEDFVPSRYHDTYRERLEEAIQAKIEGEEVQLAPAEGPEPEKVTDLLEALRASVEATRDRRSA
jgi:DNA end-binding protein Ku